MNEYQQVLFEEKQGFLRWIYMVFVASTILSLLVVSYILLYVVKDKSPAYVFMIIYAGSLLSLVFFWIFKLQTQVSEDALYVRLFPMMPWYKKIGFDEIKEFYVRQYSPILEYGGWGIKSGKSGKAYNLSGNQGVQLVLEDGKRILIGSQRADELAQAIESAKQNLK